MRANATMLMNRRSDSQIMCFVKIETDDKLLVSVLNPTTSLGFCFPSYYSSNSFLAFCRRDGLNGPFALDVAPRPECNFSFTFRRHLASASKNKASSEESVGR